MSLTDDVAAEMVTRPRRRRDFKPSALAAELNAALDAALDEVMMDRARRIARSQNPGAALFAASLHDAGEILAAPVVEHMLLYGEHLDRKPTDDEIAEAVGTALERNRAYMKRVQEAEPDDR